MDNKGKPALPPDDDFDAPKPTTDKTVAEQALQIAELQRQLAELKNRPAPEYIPIGGATEQPAGNDEDGTPLFWYKIDLPPCGGTDIKLCGVPYYHGELYKLTRDQLASIKEVVFRTWDHERNIAGSNENFYRQPTNRTLRGAGR